MCDATEIDAELSSRDTWVLHRVVPDQVWLIEPERGKPAIEIRLEPDLVRVFWARIHITLASDDADPIGTLGRVVRAIADGGVQEIYGFDVQGTFGYLGHSIRFEGGSFLALDEGVREVLRVDV
ncbi:MAG: hypothetical protein ABI632_07730 [Pseudolysinimonas sp.]